MSKAGKGRMKNKDEQEFSHSRTRQLLDTPGVRRLVVTSEEEPVLPGPGSAARVQNGSTPHYRPALPALTPAMAESRLTLKNSARCV
jgi:hypothetical protein